jgi:anti-sigma factor RsiW
MGAGVPKAICEEVLTFLWAYLGGELPPEKMAEFDRHLQGCDSCTAYLETYRETIELTQGAFPEGDEQAAEMPEDLVKAVLALRREDP